VVADEARHGKSPRVRPSNDPLWSISEAGKGSVWSASCLLDSHLLVFMWICRPGAMEDHSTGCIAQIKHPLSFMIAKQDGSTKPSTLALPREART
jgi:hypothetical protein